MLTLEAQDGKPVYAPYRDVFLGSIGEAGRTKAMALTYQLRKAGVLAECDTVGRSVKAQMKYANKTGARYTMILGDDEVSKGSAQVKEMETGESQEVSFAQLETYFKSRKATLK